MRRIIVALALAIAVIGTAIGVAAAAHSSSVEVRVAARSTDSGSVEFAIQQKLPDGSWSDYVFGRSRFFTERLHDGQWKHATPVLVSVPLPHAADQSEPSASPEDGWQLIDLGRDARTGGEIRAIHVETTQHNWPFPYDGDEGSVILRCTGSRFEAYVIWGDQYLIGTDYEDYIQADYHMGDYNLVTETWDLSTDSTSTFVRNPEAFAQELVGKTTLYVSIHEELDGLLEATFRIGGLEEAAKQLACWP